MKNDLNSIADKIKVLLNREDGNKLLNNLTIKELLNLAKLLKLAIPANILKNKTKLKFIIIEHTIGVKLRSLAMGAFTLCKS